MPNKKTDPIDNAPYLVYSSDRDATAETAQADDDEDDGEGE